MRVLTVTTADLEGLVAELAESVKRTSYDPDLIVGIRSGGAVVASMLAMSFPAARLCEVSASRGRSMIKRIVSPALRFLPRRVNSWLRMAESALLHSRGGRTERSVVADGDAINLIRSARKILIVDDAVDSGYTMSEVWTLVRGEAYEAEVKCAALTITTPDPKFRPEYYMFDDQTLIRFPWAPDA